MEKMLWNTDAEMTNDWEINEWMNWNGRVKDDADGVSFIHSFSRAFIHYEDVYSTPSRWLPVLGSAPDSSTAIKDSF